MAHKSGFECDSGFSYQPIKKLISLVPHTEYVPANKNYTTYKTKNKNQKFL